MSYNVPDVDVLVSLYNDEKLALSGIGVKFGCSAGTVAGWFKMYGINRRSGYRRMINPHLSIKTISGDDVIHIAKSDINKSVCNILKDHARDLTDDPERLSTDFMKNLIGVSCDE